jgi:hypothetical protein
MSTKRMVCIEVFIRYFSDDEEDGESRTLIMINRHPSEICKRGKKLAAYWIKLPLECLEIFKSYGKSLTIMVSEIRNKIEFFIENELAPFVIKKLILDTVKEELLTT